MTPDSRIRDEQLAWLRFALTPGLTVRQQVALLRAFGSAERAFTAPRAQVESIVGAEAQSRMARCPRTQALDSAMKWLEVPGHHLLTWCDEHYPKPLLEIHSPPCVLYARGRTELLNTPIIAIVGSRNASAQGIHDAGSFAEALSATGIGIASGLALGIDAAAHRGGLRGPGSSIAVVGTGADRVYPARNKALAEDLVAHGVIVSEFPVGTPPLPQNFPRRNRIISGLSRGVMVVEAAPRSGSLITARFAAEQGRDVFAVPGSIHSPLSKGCHQLIRDGAKLVEHADDVLVELGLRVPGSSRLEPGEDDASDPMLDEMGHAPVSIDALVERTGRSAGAISARLSILEMRGAVSALAGGLFQRLSARAAGAKRVIE